MYLVFFTFISFLALFVLSLNYFAHFSFSFLFFNIYVLSRAFDHICMEKARYKFLVIIIIINLSGYFPGCSFSASLTCEPPKGVKNSIDVS